MNSPIPPPPAMESGTLLVRVMTAGGALPLEGATVSVFAAGDENTEPLALLRTDRSGLTPPLTLPAPPRSLSLSPSPPSPPFSRYHVLVEAEGYLRRQAYDLPVFSGVQSVLPLLLLPLPLPNGEARFPDEDTVFSTVPAPDL